MAYIAVDRLEKINIFHFYVLCSIAFFTSEMRVACFAAGVDSLILACERMKLAV